MSANVEIKILRATQEDVEEIGEVFYKTWLSTYPNEEVGITVDDINDRYKNRLTEESLQKRREYMSAPKEGEIFFVAKDTVKVVGVCRVVISDDKNELQAIYVLSDYQGKGIGTLFWQELQKIFDTKKDTVVNVATYNLNAIEFYKKLGFVDTGKRFSDERFKMKSGAMIPEMEMKIKAISE